MYIKVQRNWAEVRDELKAALKAYVGSAKTLSNQAEIDYFSARRYLIKPPENQTESAKKLCSYFNIDLYMQDKNLQSFFDVVYDVWDGSEEHAHVLIELLRWSKNLNEFRKTK